MENTENMIHEPLKEYIHIFKERFRKNTAETFENLFRQSAVDAVANKKTVQRIKKLEKLLAKVAGMLKYLRSLDIFCIFLLAAGALVTVFYIIKKLCILFGTEKNFFTDLPLNIYWASGSFCVAGAACLLKYCFLNDKIAHFEEKEKEKEKEFAEKMAEAYGQMAPLNRLFEWNTVTDLVHKSCPVLSFDKFFSCARMMELEKKFHFESSLGNDTSILFCHSGSINDNPFVLAETKKQFMGTKIYAGSLLITWQERVSYTDSNGRTGSRMETRTQTLVATVEKPCPEYYTDQKLVFGSGAAPCLTFSRSPEGLAKAGNGLWGKIRMRSAIGKLLKMSNDMSTPFTIMSNREFDAVFAALDRSDEKEFRLLFTPLAQQEMLKLMRDGKYGFGEEFTFRKKKMLNFLSFSWLKDFDLSASPRLFMNYDLEASRKFFNTYSNEFFRRIYFAFAPLFAIPLYQQHVAPEDYFEEDTLYYASKWELESLANDYDPSAFQHPSCITDCILKAEPCYNADGTTTVEVTAHGFGGINRIEYVPVWGNDGRFHDVPVPYVEHYPLLQTTKILVREVDEEGEKMSAEKLFPSSNGKCTQIYYRRNIFSCTDGI